jgi:hypothetical protein
MRDETPIIIAESGLFGYLFRRTFKVDFARLSDNLVMHYRIVDDCEKIVDWDKNRATARHNGPRTSGSAALTGSR